MTLLRTLSKTLVGRDWSPQSGVLKAVPKPLLPAAETGEAPSGKGQGEMPNSTSAAIPLAYDFTLEPQQWVILAPGLPKLELDTHLCLVFTGCLWRFGASCTGTGPASLAVDSCGWVALRW